MSVGNYMIYVSAVFSAMLPTDSDEENAQCTKGGRDFYSILIFLIRVITKTCAQHLLKALNILHIKTMQEDWKKTCPFF